MRRICFALALWFTGDFVVAQESPPSVGFLRDGCIDTYLENAGRFYRKSIDLAKLMATTHEFGTTEHNMNVTLNWRVCQNRIWTMTDQYGLSDKANREGRMSAEDFNFLRRMSNPCVWTFPLSGEVYYDHVPADPVSHVHFVESINSNNEKLGKHRADFLPSGLFRGKLFVLSEFEYPKLTSENGRKLTAIGGYPYPLEKEMMKWTISVHDLRGKYSRDVIKDSDMSWALETQFASLFSEHFFVAHHRNRYFFYTRSGKVYDVPVGRTKMEQLFGGVADWQPKGLIVNDVKDMYVAVGYDTRKKQAGYYLLRDKLEIRYLELTDPPQDPDLFMATCAKEVIRRGKPEGNQTVKDK